MKSEELEKMLFVSASENYGDKYIEHLLEQYKIYISAAEAISDRRQKTNEFFLALNSALVGVLGFVATRAEAADLTTITIVASIAGAIVCYLWYRIVCSYRGLNSGKFKVIHAIEKRLPLALYDTEWEVLGRGKDRSTYWPFSHIELLVPWLFIAIYLALWANSVPWALLVPSCF